MLNLWPLCLFFGRLTLLWSAIFHRRVLAIAIPGAVLGGMYFLNALGKVVEEIEDLRRLSVFYHHGSAIEDGIDWLSFGGATLAALLLVFLTVFAFGRMTFTCSSQQK